MSGLFPFETALNMSSAAGQSPFTPTQAPDASQGWWNNASKINGNAYQAPTWNNWSYSNFNTAAPTYQGLNNGDFDTLQTNLATPGRIAAQDAYRVASNNLNDATTANGLYGSSMYTNQANDGLNKQYMNTLATNDANAASTRYGLQQKDLQFGAGLANTDWLAKLQENEQAQQLGANQNIYKNSFNTQQAQNTANGLLQTNAYNNTLLQAPWNNAWNTAAFNANQNTQTWNNLWNAAQTANPLDDALKTKQLQQPVQGQGSGTGSLLGGIGNVAGRMFANDTGNNSGGWLNSFKNLFNTTDNNAIGDTSWLYSSAPSYTDYSYAFPNATPLADYGLDWSSNLGIDASNIDWSNIGF